MLILISVYVCVSYLIVRFDNVITLALIIAAQVLVDWVLSIIVDFCCVLKVAHLTQTQLWSFIRFETYLGLVRLGSNRIVKLPEHFGHTWISTNSIDTREISRARTGCNTIGTLILIDILDHTKCTAGRSVTAKLREESLDLWSLKVTKKKEIEKYLAGGIKCEWGAVVIRWVA